MTIRQLHIQLHHGMTTHCVPLKPSSKAVSMVCSSRSVLSLPIPGCPLATPDLLQCLWIDVYVPPRRL